MSTALTALFLTTSLQFNLPDGLLESLCFIESSHRITAINKDDGGSPSLGVCQVKHSTAKWLGFKGTPKQLMEPSTNIYYAGKYLSYQIDRYNSVKRAVIAYNFGNAKNLTTSAYQRRVFKKWRSDESKRTLAYDSSR